MTQQENYQHNLLESYRDIEFSEFKELFPENEWDVGYLSERQFYKASSSPIKTKFHLYGYDVSDHIHAHVWNGIILGRYTNVGSDYSLYEEAEKILLEKFPKESFIFTYLNYKEAALMSGLGHRARNSLVYNRKFGFQCKFCAFMFIGDIKNHDNLSPNKDILPLCEGCDDCIKHCPVGAIEDDFIDAKKCDDFIGLGNHETISSMKWFWYRKMRPKYSKQEVESWTKWEDAPDDIFKWGQGIDGYYEQDGITLRKDGEPISMPHCRECVCQPRCSKAPILDK